MATIHSLAAAGRVERKRKLELQETDNKKASQSLHAHTTLSGLFSSRMFEARAIFQPCPGMSCDGAKHANSPMLKEIWDLGALISQDVQF